MIFLQRKFVIANKLEQTASYFIYLFFIQPNF